MKIKIALLLILIIPFITKAQGISFEKGSFEQALQKAQKENKLLFLEANAVWCAPCKQMSNTVFKEQSVGDLFNQNFVSYSLDIEKGNGPKLREKYGIQGLPGYVYIDGNDEVVYRSSAAMPTDQFLAQAKLALDYAKDPNSIGRLAERYTKNKDNEAFVKTYLDKLLDQHSLNYTDILEHYLSIQTTMPDSSKAMVLFLAAHHDQIIFGGKADKIISDNIHTDAWKKYVRKDIRAIYQSLPRSMISKTTEVAILRRDTSLINIALKNASRAGFTDNAQQRKRVYTYYYLKTGQGEKYKAMVHDDNVKFIKSLDQDHLRTYYLEWLEKVKAKDPQAMRLRPNSVRYSQEIYDMVKNYIPFITSDEEKQEVLSWMKAAYYIRPNSAETMSQYADVLYLIGDKSVALQIKELAYDAGKQEGLERIGSIKASLDMMKAGKEINLL